MNKGHVVAFDSKARILENAKKYTDSLEIFLEERAQAVPLLLRAMRYAEGDLKREIMCLPGSFAKEEIVWPLYDMMTDSSETEEVRQNAAIQLSVIGPLLKDSQPLIDRLLEQIESADPEQRLHATFAIGWRGNSQAVTALAEIEPLLDDPDMKVKKAAIEILKRNG